MERLEEMRRANDLAIAELNRKTTQQIAELEMRSQESTRAILQAQMQVTATLRQVNEDHLVFVKETAARNEVDTRRREKQGDKYQRRFLWIAIVGTVLAAMSVLQVLQLAYPNGIAWLVDHAPGQPAVTQSVDQTPAPNTPAAPPEAVP